MENLLKFEHPLFIIDMMYARKNNMTGRAVYEEIGYGNNAYMHKDTAAALLRAVPILREKNLKMRICDAYRPPLAHQKMLEIIPFKGFFAATPERSNHCHGTAVDVCLTDANGNNLPYPTEIDAYEPQFQQQVCAGDFAEFQDHLKKARHDYSEASTEALENRAFLRSLLESCGFEAIPHEWWHYNLSGWQKYPVIDWQKNI